MKITINALSVTIGGGLTYLLNLLPQLSKIDGENEYLLLVDKVIAKKILNETFGKNIKVITFPKLNVVLRILIEQFYLPWFLHKNKVDLLYSPADIGVILSPAKTNILAMRNPSLYTDLKIKRNIYRKWRINILRYLARISANRAQRIISVSESWRKQISEKMRVPASKIVVIHHGISKRFSNSCDEDAISPLIKDCILSVSTVYRNKNFVNLIKAFSILVKNHSIKNNLVIIGRNSDKTYFDEMEREIKVNKIEKRVYLLREINYYSLINYYRHASVFVFPSYLETFGHPLLEAMISQVPIAASDIPVFREICENAAIYFDPHNPYDIADKIISILENKELRDQLVNRSALRKDCFTWEKSANALLKVFEEVCLIK
jgi:glycosyltransferase involved in cell wall biosynthesis